MATQTEKERSAYREGLKLGERLLSGNVRATRDAPPGGKQYYQEAAATAEYLNIAEDELLGVVSAFHRERLDALPDPEKYPETRGERDVLLKKYEGMREAGMDQVLIALHQSLTFWQKYRMPEQYGRIYNPVAVGDLKERCRIVYMPESDHGPLHFKNVDDPLATWTPYPPEEQGLPWPHSPLMFDGTGSGLHIDEPAEEIFPLDCKRLCREHCGTIAEAEEFLVRYNHFWGGGNLLVHDEKGNSVAFDKASRSRVAARQPDSSGINYINGMSSFDPEYEAFINQQRQLYLQKTGQSEDSEEACYFRFCHGVLENMKGYMKELKEKPTLGKLISVMTSRDPDGALCKSGQKVHPNEKTPAGTLMQRLFFLKSRILLRRQWRGNNPVWEDPWEQVQYV